MFFSDKYKTEKKIASILTEKKLVLSIAESCTGGLISSRLTDLSGASKYIKENFVTYSNEAKIKYLGVDPNTLKEFGAVSEETATEMAAGLVKSTGCDVSLAVTGVAGPSGGRAAKPVGNMFIAVSYKGITRNRMVMLNSDFDRIKMKQEFALRALKFLLEQLDNSF